MAVGLERRSCFLASLSTGTCMCFWYEIPAAVNQTLTQYIRNDFAKEMSDVSFLTMSDMSILTKLAIQVYICTNRCEYEIN